MKSFFLVLIMIFVGVTNYSKVCENFIEPLMVGDHGSTFDALDSYVYNSLALNMHLTEELFTFPADGTIFVSQAADAYSGTVSGGISGSPVWRFSVQ